MSCPTTTLVLDLSSSDDETCSQPQVSDVPQTNDTQPQKCLTIVISDDENDDGVTIDQAVSEPAPKEADAEDSSMNQLSANFEKNVSVTDGSVLRCKCRCQVVSVSAAQKKCSHSLQPVEHIVELTCFATTLRTVDFRKLLHSYQKYGFRLKWVDAGHVLVIFKTPIIAKHFLKHFEVDPKEPVFRMNPVTKACLVSRAVAECSICFGDGKDKSDPITRKDLAFRATKSPIDTKVAKRMVNHVLQIN